MGRNDAFDIQSARQIPFRGGYHNLPPGETWDFTNDHPWRWSLVVLGWGLVQVNIPTAVAGWFGVIGLDTNRVVMNGHTVTGTGPVDTVGDTDLAIGIEFGAGFFVGNDASSVIACDAAVWGIFLPAEVLLSWP